MKILDSLRLWWQKQTGEEETPFDGDAPAWAISLVIHLGIFFVLAALTFGLAENDSILVLAPNQIDEEELIEPEQFAFAELEQPEIGANSINGVDAALAEAPIEADFSEIPEPEPIAEVGNVVMESIAVTATAPTVNANAAVRGTATGVGSTGALGAIDRITHEIILSLEQSPTMVVWLFDESGSLARQREAIRGRFDRIYRELGVIEESGHQSFDQYEDKDKPLLTSVVSFGQQYTVLTPKPTDNVEEIKAAVAAIKNDASGQERVFAAVHQTSKQFAQYRIQSPRRNVMIVVFTDEAGDDQQLLDPAIDLCRKWQMPVYVVGVPAPFGRKDVEIKYRDPDPEFDQSVQWVPVHQGPESLMPERVKLHFDGSDERDEPIDSGFGPYSLTRLCYETGGIYFAVHPNRNHGKRTVGRRETEELAAHLSHFFDPVVMRRYRPDYLSANEYKALVESNKARMALVNAATMSWASAMRSPQLEFVKRDEGSFANELSDAQKDAAMVAHRVEPILATLEVGKVDRERLRRPRWQAGYDLAMGRSLAVLVRAQSYNAMLASAKQGMKFKKEKNNTWVLEPADDASISSRLEKMAEQARMYLNRVVKEHEGTPWALLAAKELEQPIGWRWTETYTPTQAERVGAGNGNANPADDMRRMMKKPKKKRRPKL